MDAVQKTMTVKPGGEVKADTYFNFFSYEKWMKYTSLGNVSLTMTLQGCCDVILTRVELHADGYAEEYVLKSVRIDEETPVDVTFDYPSCPVKGLLAFKIRALTPTTMTGGAYCSDVDEQSLEDVNIAICICTYRREDYVYANMKMLQDTIFTKPESMLHGHLRAYIADNGQTLDTQMLQEEAIKVFPNLNGGGAAGFTRAMMEANADKDTYGLTHFILMDDDLVFTQQSLERTYMFLRFLKPEYRDCMLGGAMLKLNEPYRQHAAGETWDVHAVTFNKVNYNMRKVKDILRTELLESTNQLAWWYCCFPISEQVPKDLALPIFFQYDDFDYNLRHQERPKITMIGICVWHEAFEKKESTSKNYYALRNSSIIGTLHGGPAFSAKLLKRRLMRHIFSSLVKYQYKTADLYLRAVGDYLQGFSWLAAQNPQELNTEIMKSAYQMQDIQKLPMRFTFKELKTQQVYDYEGRLRRLFRRLTLNGCMLPARGDVIVPSLNTNISFLYRKKRILFYDIDTQRGYITEKNWKESFRIMRALFAMMRSIDRNFNKTVEQYHNDYPQYITEEFWRKYLGLEVEK